MYYRVQSEGVTHRINYRGEDVFEFDVNSGWTIYSVTYDEGEIIIHIAKNNNPQDERSADKVSEIPTGSTTEDCSTVKERSSE